MINVVMLNFLVSRGRKGINGFVFNFLIIFIFGLIKFDM